MAQELLTSILAVLGSGSQWDPRFGGTPGITWSNLFWEKSRWDKRGWRSGL